MTSVRYLFIFISLVTKKLRIKGLRQEASNRLPFLLLSSLRSWQKHSLRGARRITLRNPLVFIFCNSPMSPFHKVRVAVIFRISLHVTDLVTVIRSIVQRFSAWCSHNVRENWWIDGGLCGWLCFNSWHGILMFVLLHSWIKKSQEPRPNYKGSMKWFDKHFSFLSSNLISYWNRTFVITYEVPTLANLD